MPPSCSSIVTYLDAHLGKFLGAFWPNLVATLIGVAVGIPVALAIQRVVTRGHRHAEVAARRSELANLKRVTIALLHEQRRELDSIAAIDPARIMTYTTMPLEAWAAVRERVFVLIHEPAVKADLASHFEEVGRVTRHAEQRSQRALARAGIGHISSPAELEEGIAQNLVTHMKRLSAAVEPLVARLETLPLDGRG